jgi:catechol 2,3-dioxygenase-like lactoylglutathione lyase family enzyme
MSVRSLVWMGVRTHEFQRMVELYRDVMGLELTHQTEHAVWFRLGDGNEVHVYAQSDEDHDFFGTGPVVGFLVDDFAATRARMSDAGIECIGQPQEEAGVIWNRYRAPDGNIYEIMQRGKNDELG